MRKTSGVWGLAPILCSKNGADTLTRKRVSIPNPGLGRELPRGGADCLGRAQAIDMLDGFGSRPSLAGEADRCLLLLVAVVRSLHGLGSGGAGLLLQAPTSPARPCSSRLLAMRRAAGVFPGGRNDGQGHQLLLPTSQKAMISTIYYFFA